MITFTYITINSLLHKLPGNVIYRSLQCSLPWDGIRPWLAETWEYHYTDVYLSVTNLYHILFVALLISAIRYTATHAILKV